MNRTLFKTALRLIRTTKGRFFSLTAIVMIGVAFFAGVSSISFVMADSVKAYDDRQNLKDITIYSGYGFDEEDIEAVRRMDGVINAEGAQFADVYATSGSDAVITRIHSYQPDSQINRFVLKSGRMPENDREALAEEGTDLIKGFPIGSEVTLFIPDGDLSDALKYDRFTVVGTIDTPVYLNMTKENSTLSNQYLKTYLYVMESAFAYEDMYTEMNVLLLDGKNFGAFSDAYYDYAEKEKEKIEVLAETQADHRRDVIVARAKKEYDKGWQKYLDGQKEFDEKIADGEKQLAEAEQELRDGEKELQSGQKELEEGEREIEEGKKQLEEGRGQLEDGKKQLEDAKRQLEEGRKEGEEKLRDAREQIEEGYRELEKGKAEYEKESEKYLAQKKQLEEALNGINRPLITPKDTIAQDLEFLPEKTREIAGQFLALFEIDPKTHSILDLTDRFRSTCAELAQMNRVIDEKKKTYAAEHEGKEIETYGELKALMGDSDPTFSKIEALIQDCELRDETPLSEFESAVSITSDALQDASLIIDAIVRDQLIPDWITIQTASILSEDILTLAKGLGLNENNTMGELREAIRKAIAQIEEGLEEGKKKIEDGQRQLKEAEAQVREGEKELEEKLAEGQRQIDEGWQKIAENEEKLKEGENELAEALKKLEDGRKELEKGKREWTDGWAKLKDGQEELEEKKADGLKELNEAKEDLDKAKQDIEDLEEGSWTVLDRSMHYASETYRETIHQMEAIASIFPVFFLAVAALVCLTTMTRLLSEQRTQIGVLRALGYSGMQCAMIYLLYASLASLIGSLLGAVIGLLTFPAVIYNTWRMMYILPDMVMNIPWRLVFLSVAAFLSMMLGVTGYVIFADLREVPSQLMRPKAPKLGKQTILASIPFLWEKLSFSWKVTIRNLVRYKQRMIMTVIGVSGCTALLLTGFGISDSINNMVNLQFGEIMHYDGIAEIDSDHLSASEIPRAVQKISSLPGVKQTVSAGVYSGKVMSGKMEDTASVMVFHDPEDLASICTLRTRKGHEPLTLSEDGVLISEKLAENLHLSAGDTITVESRKGLRREVPIRAVTEMYIRHYVFMTSDFYRETFGTEMGDNCAIIAVTEDADLPSLKHQLSLLEEVNGIDFNDTVLNNFTDMVKNIDAVVLVLIFSSMALAFVVLGNLTNVNIAERQREIATIKVLGFRKKEVENYIYKENNILVICGALLGIPLGKWLHGFIMGEIEMDYVMFGRSVNLSSIAEAALLTVGFGLLVNLFMRRKLLNIQMVESLKSVE